jgi:hypothetical protein
VADWWQLNAAEKIAHIRSSATETSQAAELSKQAVHALTQQMLAIADSSFEAFEPTHARRARDTPDSGLMLSNTTLNNFSTQRNDRSAGSFGPTMQRSRPKHIDEDGNPLLTSKVRAAIQLYLVSAELAKARRLMPNTCGICGGHVQECIRIKIHPSDNRPVPMYPGGCKGLQHTPRDIIKRLNDLSWRNSKEDAQASGRERNYKRTANSDATLEFSRKRYEAFHNASNGDGAGTSTQSTPHKG